MKRNRDVWRGLVAVEGIDGAGTTTLVRNLHDALTARGISIESGCEPTAGAIGRVIRAALAGDENLSPESLALLFAADRREHLFGENGIRCMLDEGRVYITDRYWFSSLAYQTLESDWDWVDGLNADYPLPGHLVFLGLSVAEAQKRISGRGSKDIFDDSDLQHRVADAYERAIGTYSNSGMKILFVDSTKSPETVCAETLAFVADILE